MTEYRYKNTSESAVTLIGIGQFEAGEEFTTEQVIENPHIKFLGVVEPETQAETAKEEQ